MQKTKGRVDEERCEVLDLEEIDRSVQVVSDIMPELVIYPNIVSIYQSAQQ
jgi:hypothetical protein